MAMEKKDKYDILASVIDAIYDENQEVKVETTDEKGFGQIGIPSKRGKYIVPGTISQHRWHAKSIKIGKISMRFVPPAKEGGYGRYVIRTPDGELMFKQDDRDLAVYRDLWDIALLRYDYTNNNVKNRIMTVKEMYKHIKQALTTRFARNFVNNDKLLRALNKDFVAKDKKSKFDKAKENMEAFGIHVTDEQLKKRLVVVQGKRYEK